VLPGLIWQKVPRGVGFRTCRLLRSLLADWEIRPTVVAANLSQRAIFAALCLLPAACCLAQCTGSACRGPVAAHGSVVRVVNTGASGNRYYGSGTLVDKDGDRGIVLTCAHLFRREVGAVVVVFGDARRFAASLISVDQAWDLAALEILPPKAEPVAVADGYPRPGELLESCGYGREGRYWCNRGRALGYARTATTQTHETLQLTGSARDGDSGGPVFNQRGELVAVVWGTDGRTVGGTYCGRIRRFLAGLRCRRPGSRGRGPAEAPMVPVEPVARAPSTPPNDQEPAVSPTSIEEILGRLDGLNGDVRKLDRRLNEQEDSAGRRLKMIETAVAAVREKTESVTNSETLRETIRQTVRPMVLDRGPDAVKTLMPWVLAALGIGGATPAGLAAWGLWSVISGRRAAAGGAGPRVRPKRRKPKRPTSPAVIRDEALPPPQIVRRNREFVSYQVPDRRLKALEWAHDEYVRRYPGARPVIETIEAYADQYESGMKGKDE